MMNRHARVEQGRLDGSALLVEEVAKAAFARSHTVGELATALGIHPSHWHRLRRGPAALRRCKHQTLEAIADYIGWPVGRVLLSCGKVSASDLQIHLHPDQIVRGVLKTLQAGPLGATLQTGLDTAAPDHQRLIAELFLLAEVEALRR
jgi:hypothetical protein